MNKKAIIITVIATSLGAALGTFVVRSLMGTDAGITFDKVLVQVANETNKTLPMMVDKETRLDATFSGPGNVFTYSYTLVNFTKDNVDTSNFRKIIQPKILTNYKTHDQMKSFRDHNVELHYQYKDKNGVFLTDIVITPKDF